MGVSDGLYQLVLLLHVTAVVVGFGSMFLTGVYLQAAQKRGNAGALAVSEANLAITRQWALPFIYAVPVFGIALVILSDGTWGFDQLWISLSFLTYIAAVGLAHAVVLPSHRRLNQVTAELASMGEPAQGPSRQPPPQLAELERQGRKLAAAVGAFNLLVIATIALMIWKPGV